MPAKGLQNHMPLVLGLNLYLEYVPLYSDVYENARMRSLVVSCRCKTDAVSREPLMNLRPWFSVQLKLFHLHCKYNTTPYIYIS